MVKPRYIVPNLFTGLNFLLGVACILLAAESLVNPGPVSTAFGTGKEPLILSAWMLVWCVLLDKLDGFAAKMLNASSDFGAQFDSLADLLAFGIAPSILAYFFVRNQAPEWFFSHRPLMVVSMAVYSVCAAMRLARFNAIDTGELGSYFHGLASTFAGGLVCTSLILFDKFGMSQKVEYLNFIPGLLVLCGVLMVSPFYLPKLVKRKSKWVNGIQVINVILVYVCGFTMQFPEYLLGAALTYGVIGFAYGYLKKDEIAPHPKDE